MFVNKAKDGKLNTCGSRIAEIRLAKFPKQSQREFADVLQQHHLDVDKNAIQKIESHRRFVTEIELQIIAEVLGVSPLELLDRSLLP